MTSRQRIINFYKRWDVPLDRQKEFEAFKNRILRAVDRTVGHFILGNPSVSSDLSYHIGHRSPTTSATGMAPVLAVTRQLQGRKFSDDAVYEAIDSAADPKELLFTLQSLFWVLENSRCSRILELAEAVSKAVESSPWAEVRVARRGNRVTLYPRGVPVLDEGIVNDTLEWLAEHRQVAKALERALALYQEKDTANYRDLVDNLRVAIERLIRRVLRNRKSLEKQGRELAKWLNRKGLQAQLCTMIQNTVAHLAAYNNDCIKHDDANRPGHRPSEAEVEFLIYQTGTVMRLLLELNGGRT